MADEVKATGGILRNPFYIGEEDPPGLVVPLTSDMLAPNVRTAITSLLGEGVTVDPPLRQRLLSAAERGLLERRAVKNAAAIRHAVVEQFTAALLTGLDDLERHNIGRYVSPGDVADLVHRVAAEVGRG